MNHAHTHDHSHTPSPAATNIGRLSIVLGLTTLYMIVEFAGGMWSNSLALIADAGHMLTDVGAIGLALFAAWFSEHPASPQKTYGYYRLEIFAAFMNGVALAVISFFIVYEALQRLGHPPQIQGNILTWVATGGLVINLSSAAVLFSAGQSNINIRGAFIHILSDTVGSLGAIIAGICIIYFKFYQADPIFSILIAVLVLYNGWKLMQEALNILLEACPVHLSVTDIETALMNLPEIQAVHDLHVWSITCGKEALSAHIVVNDVVQYTPQLVTKIQDILKEKFGLTHSTIQLEPPDFEEDEIHF